MRGLAGLESVKVGSWKVEVGSWNFCDDDAVGVLQTMWTVVVGAANGEAIRKLNENQGRGSRKRNCWVLGTSVSDTNP